MDRVGGQLTRTGGPRDASGAARSTTGGVPASRRALWYGLPVPALLVVGASFLVPVGVLLHLSLTEPTTGLDNYFSALGDQTTRTILFRTVRMAVLVTLLCLLVAYPYAYTMTVCRRWVRVLMIAVVLMPFWTSLMARTFAWVVLLGDTGPINRLLGLFGVGPVSILGTTTAVTIGTAQVLLPFLVLPLYANLKGIDRRLVRAAVGLGARPVVAFLRVYLPLSVPGILAGSSVVFVLALGFYVTPALLGSPRQWMVSQLIASRVQNLLQFGMGGALAVLVLVLTLGLLALTARAARSSVAAASAGREP